MPIHNRRLKEVVGYPLVSEAVLRFVAYVIASPVVRLIKRIVDVVKPRPLLQLKRRFQKRDNPKGSKALSESCVDSKGNIVVYWDRHAPSAPCISPELGRSVLVKHDVIVSHTSVMRLSSGKRRKERRRHGDHSTSRRQRLRR